MERRGPRFRLHETPQSGTNLVLHKPQSLLLCDIHRSQVFPGLHFCTLLPKSQKA